MESHEILRNAFKETSPKVVASELGVSLSLVYKWSQEQSDLGSGSRNPIDRIVNIYELTQHQGIIEHLTERCGGYFVRNPDSHCRKGFQYLPATNAIVSQFSHLLTRISTAALDNTITSDEAKEIRQVWDQLKGYAEGFVRCCEEGDFEIMHERTTPQQTDTPDEPRRTLY
ncbi:phage regulatory CII family protein [Rubritalea sp.]|uniref:phage regulatory CII family protein n=1 Tax=Rubritalea sp. TaxID=2109375 RepID=UPI003EF279CC